MQAQQARVSGEELKQIVIADIALIIGFALVFSGGLLGAIKDPHTFLLYIPVAAVGVTLSFVLHELMHKFFAQRYGAVAGFRSSQIGLIITLGSSMFGFLLGLPGATYVYASNFTRKENGIVSLVGPLTNIVIFFIALVALIALQSKIGNGLLGDAIAFTMFINLWLAFINMLPIMPFDGAKVFYWNKLVYFPMMLAIIILLVVFESSVFSLYTLLLVLILSYIMSMSYRLVL